MGTYRMQRGHVTGNHGFSLIEIMISLGITSAIALGSTQMLVNILVNQNTLYFRINTEEFANEIRQQLMNSESCTNTLEDITLASGTQVTIPYIKDQTGNILYSGGSAIQNTPLLLKSVQTTNYTEFSATNGELVLELQLESTKRVNGSRVIAKNIKVKTLKAGTELVECNGEAAGSESPWQVTPPNSTYINRNVGIGTANPAVALDVEGTIRGQYECRKVVGIESTSPVTVTCDADEFLMSGGGSCATSGYIPDHTKMGFLHMSEPLPDLSGWVSNCYAANPNEPGAYDIPGNSWAVCCKK